MLLRIQAVVVVDDYDDVDAKLSGITLHPPNQRAREVGKEITPPPLPGL